MSKPIIATARQVAAELRTQENAIDAAIAGQARLIGTLLDARLGAGVPATFGSEALERAFEAIDHGRALRGAVLSMHRELAQVNIREVAVGDVSECPELLAAPKLAAVPDAQVG